jgi:hypothetical protein
MLFVGILILFVASSIQCWYSANARARLGNAAMAFHSILSLASVGSLLLLGAALGIIWLASSLIWVLVALVVYFFALPLILVPMFQRIYPAATPGESSHISRIEADAEWNEAAGLNTPLPDAPVANDFWLRLFDLFNDATSAGERSIDVQAGQLHKSAGWYPGPNHRMPMCCRVMRDEMQPGDLVVAEPPKGAGASLVIRYFLPRVAEKSD